MLTRSNIQLLPLLLFCIWFAVGCAGDGNPVAPSDSNTGIDQPRLTDDFHPGIPEVIGTDGPRELWGLYTITITPDGEASVTPSRDPASHLNVTIFLKPPHCFNCITLQVTGLDTDVAWIKLNVGLSNPIPIGGYDVRGIILADEDYYLMNADAKTIYAGKNILSLPSGFKAYATEEPNNLFPPGSGSPAYYYQEFQIHIPPPYEVPKLLQIQYAVDVSWPLNCEDPWYIGSLELDAPMYENTPEMDFTLEVRDHQNDVESVILAPPDSWGGDDITLTQIIDNFWEGAFDDCLGKTPGTYMFEAMAVSKDGATGTIELPLYKDFELIVNEVDCTDDPKATPSGAEILELYDWTWDLLCPDNPMDYYRIDFSNTSMQQPGVLSGTVTLESCVPYQRLDLVYYNPNTLEYFDGPSVTGQGDNAVVFKLHIPNSVFIGDVAEQCYLRVSGPATGAIDAPYKLSSNLVYELVNCGDPVSISTIGAPDLPLSSGMLQGVLCDSNLRDWYRLDFSGTGIEPGRLTGILNFEIEQPATIPPGEAASISLRDEEGRLLVNFYETLGTPIGPIDLADLDLPSMFIYYLLVDGPGTLTVDQYYRAIWDISVDPTCEADIIGPDNPDPSLINPVNVPWMADTLPGSSVRMWLCDPSDIIDAYPFEVPGSWPGAGDVIGGSIRIASDDTSFDSLRIRLGLEDTTTGQFCWYKALTPTGTDQSYLVMDTWQVPTYLSGYPLRYWIGVENQGADQATAEVNMNLTWSTDCTSDSDSDEDPSGMFVPDGTASGLLSHAGDLDDYWELEWEGLGRILGNIGVAADNEIQIQLYSHGQLLETEIGQVPIISVNSYDFGPGCFGPILKITAIGGGPADCIQYFITGTGLTEFSACNSDPDQNDTIEDIQDKPWLWIDPFEELDEVCGVVCRDDSQVDVDVIGILGQPFTSQGVLYGNIAIESTTPDGHQVGLFCGDLDCIITEDNLDPPDYRAVLELAPFNLPAIPPAGFEYYIQISPDPTGADSLNPYHAIANLGINDDLLCVDDGHDLQMESWHVEIPDARLGILCGFGELNEIDLGIADLCDWFRLDYDQQPSEYLEGQITLICDIEDVTVRLMLEGEPAGTGIALFSDSIPNGGSSVTITLPAATIPSIPTYGDYYYIAVHNNGVGGWASYILDIDLTSE